MVGSFGSLKGSMEAPIGVQGDKFPANLTQSSAIQNNKKSENLFLYLYVDKLNVLLFSDFVRF